MSAEEVFQELFREKIQRLAAFYERRVQPYLDAMDEVHYDATAPGEWENEGGALLPQHDG